MELLNLINETKFRIINHSNIAEMAQQP